MVRQMLARSDKKAFRISIIIIFFLGAATILSSALGADGWRRASRESAGLAPSPQEEPQAVVQAYAARVWGWRGLFADHTWIATKDVGANFYTVYEVIGWRLRRGMSAVRIARDIPDRRWFGSKPRLLAEVRGDQAAKLIPQITAAAQSYPYPHEYHAFPGPNSNTFTAWVAKHTPEFGLRLPWRAVGRSYTAPPRHQLAKNNG